MKPVMPVAAILFDLDGTLVDSERESAEAMARVLRRDLALTVTDAQRDFVVGHSWREIYARLRADFGEALSLTFEELVHRSGAVRVDVIAEQGMRIMPGAVQAVRGLQAYTRAIVTGSAHDEVRQALGVLGLADCFQLIVAAEDYSQGKPSPEGYLSAARRLDVPPDRCLVIEDSAAGVAAGRAAGMTVVAVRAGNFLEQDQSAAHRIIDTLEELTPALVEELVT
jgi:HAD superfamily hydrolase (TIGR01509 family)